MLFQLLCSSPCSAVVSRDESKHARLRSPFFDVVSRDLPGSPVVVGAWQPPSECGFTKEKAGGTNLTPDLDAFADAASPPKAGLLVKLQDDHFVKTQ